MSQASRKWDRSWLAGGVIVAALIVFFGLNMAAGVWLKTARLDLTQDSLFTLSDGTRETLAEIDEPITLRFYKSAIIDELGPFYRNYARRVAELLDEYARHADGMLIIETYDPAAFSPEEDLAVADGLEGIPISREGDQLFFGLAGFNSTDDRDAVAYLAPERAMFLEYDLTRLVHDLANPEKPVVAVIGDLQLMGDPSTRYQPWFVTEIMRQFFDVRVLGGTVDRIDDDVSVLVLAQPANVDDQTLYAIDQYALSGGHVLAFLDPAPEIMVAGQQPGTPPPTFQALTPLLTAWGIEIPMDQVVGDPDNAVAVQAADRTGRPAIVPYLPWVSLGPDAMAGDDVILANLERIHLNSAGIVRPIDGAATTFEPILQSTDQAGLVDAFMVTMMPDPVGLIQTFQPGGDVLTYAARVSGTVASAFPDGPPETVTDQEIVVAHRSEGDAPLNMIVVADADILSDRSWLRTEALLGQRYTVPTANNGDFAVNALENLSGSAGLIALRGRGLTDRPFELLQAMQRDAEQRFRDAEETLLTQIDEAEARITQLRQEEQDSGILLTGAQQQTIDEFRGQMLELRQQLRDVQHSLRQDVERVEQQIRIANIWAVPALVALIAIGLAIVRRVRMSRRRAVPA